MDNAPWWVAATYLVYLIAWEGLVIGGCAHVVFWREASGWWFVLAVILATSPYRPHTWHALFNADLAHKQMLIKAEADKQP